MKPAFLVLICSVVCLSGCATYPVQVAAFRESAPAVPGGSYFLDPEASVSVAHSPQFEPALRCLRAALAHRGLTEVTRREDANVTLGFSYEVTRAGTEVWHRTHSTEVSKSQGPIVTTSRPVQPAPPTREVFVVQQRESIYHISMRVEARDAKTNRAVWRVETSAFIGPNDRNAILPCMIAAAEPFFDPPADTTIDVAVGQASAEVRALRNRS